jgi:hypothetical protein
MSLYAIMLVTLGAAGTALLGFLIGPAFWRRAVRLTTRRIKESMPLSEAEVRADRDRLRAEFATELFRLEQKVERARLVEARHAIELARRDAGIGQQQARLRQLELDLEEARNARVVLEQTITDRLPRIEQRLEEAKILIAERDREIEQHTADAGRLQAALEEAAGIHAQQQAEIERLEASLVAAGAANLDRGLTGDGETALRAELEATRARARDQASLLERLHVRMVDETAGGGSGAGHLEVDSAGPEAEIDRLRRALYDARVALEAARVTGAQEAADALVERERRRLIATSEDQAGEIARLRAALAQYEAATGGSEERGGTIRESKIALKARLGSVQALADQQAETIRSLRVELAATHERMARQAQHYTVELRRLGAGTVPTGMGEARTEGGGARRPRNGARRGLADRVERARLEAVTSPREAPPPLPTQPVPVASVGVRPSPAGVPASEVEAEARPFDADPAAAPGSAGESTVMATAAAASTTSATTGPPADPVASEASAAASSSSPVNVGAVPSPVEPQPAAVGAGGRRGRLVDRISSLSRN